MSLKIVIKYDLLSSMNLSSRKIQAMQLWIWPTKAGPKWISKKILKYLWIHSLVLPVSFQKTGKQQTLVRRVIFTSYFLLYSIVDYFTQFNERLPDDGDRKNLGPPMPKQNDDSCLQEDQESYSTCTFLLPAKLMLRISNIFLHLVEMTLYHK